MSFWQIFRHWLHQTLSLWVSVWKADFVSAKQKDMYVVASITGCPANLSTDVPPWIETIILLWSGISAIHIQYSFKGVSNKANHPQWMARAFILSSVSSSGHMLDVGKVITYHTAVQRTHVYLEAMFGAPYQYPDAPCGFESEIKSSKSPGTIFILSYYLLLIY